MTLKITTTRVDALLEAFNKVFDRWNGADEGNCFYIDKANSMYNWLSPTEIVELGINWSACGTQTTEATQKFISRLSTATKLVKAINDMHIVCDKEMIDRVEKFREEGNAQTAKILWDNYVEMMKMAIEGDWIVPLLVNGGFCVESK